MRIAAIDIGTNSIHMVIADAESPSGFEVIDREREVVQIGRGSFGTARLRADAVRDTVDALRRFVQLARRHQVDRILCTATAAVREARNGGEFIAAAREASGIAPRAIPGSEEGRLIYLAVKSALQLDQEPTLIVDIGGGSVQLVVGDRDRVLHAVSVPLGALRLTETLLRTDPPTRRELQRLRRTITRALKEPLAAIAKHPIARVCGSSGSIHALAHIAHALESGEGIAHINGHVLPLESLEQLSRQLRRMTTAEREKLRGIDAKRAEIIVPGAMVLEHVLAAVDADGITISDYGVREGLVTDYLVRHAQEITAIEQVEDLRLRSVLQCVAKFSTNATHPKHVARLTLALFDGLQREHGLDPHARDLAHFAALLHDVGSAIGYDRHAEHSAYIIENANLRGLTAEDVRLVAAVARYHSKARPRKRDSAYAAVSKTERRSVRWLAGLLRIAEGLDRSHYQLIRSLRVVRRGGRVAIHASAKREAQLEIWAARRRVDVLEKMLGAPVQIRAEAAKEGASPAARRKRATAGAPGPRLVKLPPGAAKSGRR